ncbi:MAG: hypothetical protein RIS21_460 [Planctomycetota bacterium]|jgi:NADH-quinone oxidoreductase subunit J
MQQAFFWLFAAVAVGAGLFAVTRRRPLACALSLVVSFVGLAGLYAQLGASFPATLQVLVYAGAIMVLVVFVLMLLNLPEDAHDRVPDPDQDRMWPVFLVAPLGILLVFAVRGMDLPKELPALPADFGTVAGTGRLLFGEWVWPFELASLLLLVAVVGAVVIAKKKLD